jgi:hypothetical protein
LKNPFTYRPGPDADVDHDGKVPDWEDNALSNGLAWASTVFTPTWCQNEQHWSARFANTLFTSCPCCMIFRGITIGFVLGSVLWSTSILLLCLVAKL